MVEFNFRHSVAVEDRGNYDLADKKFIKQMIEK